VASDREAIARRRRRFMATAMSTVTLSAATVQAQVCLSMIEPEELPCSYEEESELRNGRTPEALLAVARCYEERERNLDKAIALYREYIATTRGDKEQEAQRNRVAWSIDRLERIAAADRDPKAHAQRPCPDVAVDAPAEVEPDDPEVVVPGVVRPAGPASCGCDVPGGPSNGLGLGAAGAALLVVRRRRRRR
jgi:MYXO-CTERM domain-containing protein